MLIDEQGRIASQGLVNNREQLESLLTAKELGRPIASGVSAKTSSRSAIRQREGSYPMSKADSYLEAGSRKLASLSSRRGLLAKMAGVLIGAAVLYPVLPIARSRAGAKDGPAGLDIGSCDYWKYCGLGGNLCTCCGGSSNQCAVGTVPSKVYWVGTCKSASDGKDYMIAYRDCCGQSPCGQCFCDTSKGAKPGYTMGLHQDMDWCMDNESLAIYCTTATVVGEA